MVSLKTAVATAMLAAGVSAAPSSNSYGGGKTTPPPADTAAKFSGLAARSASPIHYSPLTAFSLSLWLGGTTATYCPKEVVGNACPKGTETVLYYGNGGLSMDDMVPGGQTVYVGPNGAVGYTQAHSAGMPPGSVTGGFKLEDTGRGYSILSFPKSGFIACPAKGGKGPWKVFIDLGAKTKDSDVPSGKKADCLGFTMLASTRPTTESPAAWQYT